MVCAVSVNVLSNHHIWYLSPFYRDGDIAKWTYRDLDILKVKNVR